VLFSKKRKSGLQRDGAIQQVFPQASVNALLDVVRFSDAYQLGLAS